MRERQTHEPVRLVFLDVLRLIAAVQMIQGHSVDALLAAEHRHGTAFAAWSFSRGLTSVIFLVTAGFSFVLAESRGGSAGRVRRSKRALMLIALGYLMHAPFGILLGTAPRAALEAAIVVDVLQCIGVSLLALELTSLLVVRPALRVMVALAVAASCFLLAPASARLDLPDVLRPIANYATTRHGSSFPLIPWAGYMFAGFGVGTIALRPRWEGGRARWAGPAVLGAAALAWGLLAPLGPASPLSPAYCALKLSCVFGLSAALMAAFHRARLPRWLDRLASETLFLYVSHVVILYADHVGLAPCLGRRFGPGVGVAVAVGLMIVCGAGALARSRRRAPLRARAQSGTRGASS